ncbi:transcriptional repressor [Actinoplanes sp. NBRC 103695]|uniref:Fur family transcriptional regulator n=1 Tax=Actinoplanes sp. NBRC 103695 TaxID=3032202 RepID=UPI0024A5393B|nr:transcriptional repressor [Actinoplanes sp. NBRC 103695]GLZ01584.1 hypothetical protein Acsp02_88350 [Actinoplanes sp. NBRC 103695]
MTSQDRATRAWRILDAAGARHTMARGLVIDVLAETDGHLSVAAIHEKVAASRPEVNVSTVHRTVNFLVERGVAHVLPWPGEALFGLNESPHVHAICEGCGRHFELPASDLGKAVAEARRHSGLELGATGMALIGRCQDCA